MGFIDIWGMIEDYNKVNTPDSIIEAFDYIDPEGRYTNISKAYALATGKDTINNLLRYLPPMHAIVLKTKAAATSLGLTLNTSRVVTSANKVVRAGAPRRNSNAGLRKGIMTVTAINPLAAVCKSRLVIGQGYSKEVLSGEDAILTTINTDNYNSSTPSMPFNIYALEEGSGLSIDLLDSVINVPLSFYMSPFEYDPETQLWFTGVNNIDADLVLFDSISGTERPIIDGICLKIETPEQNHLVRYYIRSRGFKSHAGTSEPSISTDDEAIYEEEQYSDTAIKFIKDDHVYILRRGHVYTVFGQKVQ